MKVYISGKQGFIGSNLAKYMNSKYEVISEEFLLRNIERVVNFKPDVIIHCAARVGSMKCSRNYYDTYESNILGTCNIANIAKQLNAYFVFASSIDVYKFESLYNIIDETSKIGTHTLYGRTKLEGEYICKGLLNNFLILRLGYIFGKADEDYNSLISLILQGKKVDFVGEYSKDYLYIDDCVSAIEKLISAKVNGIVNIGSGFSYSVKKILQKLDRDNFEFSSLDYTKNFTLPSKILRTRTDWEPKVNFWDKIEELKK